ncbi:MAG: preprotein translocase subunit SecA [Burkholderiaceae bacterium]
MNATLDPRWAWARYPQRRAPSLNRWQRGWEAALAWWRGQARPAQLTGADLAAIEAAGRVAQDLAGEALAVHLAALRRRLRAEGLDGAAALAALGVAGALLQRTLGLQPYPAQYLGARLILRGHLAEMATGEGKTLVAGLAAAVAALAGRPVHVMTANDYLAERDATQLQIFYEALGLRCGFVLAAFPPELRQTVYQRDVVHVAARELAFDYLRDHLSLGAARDPRQARLAACVGGSGAAPVLPWLCFGILDEADSILLDEATTPLILSGAAAAADEPAARHAFFVALGLRRERDYRLLMQGRVVQLTESGRQQVEAYEAWPARRMRELVEAALAALVVYQRGRQYTVQANAVVLIDEVTGRLAEGRRWMGDLQAMVEIKEGLPLSPALSTVAQITYPRFLERYLHLGGMSGTLAEARLELGLTYFTPVTRVALARPMQRRWLGTRLFAHHAERDAAVIERVVALHRAQRPVLVATDSVSASQRLAARLAAAGLAHQVLNAEQSAQEAARVACAGASGRITVSTNMAGRGTDIRLDAAARHAGGLAVLICMSNPARRIDRQLLGRSGRQGDPGSGEAWLALDEVPLLRAHPLFLRLAGAALRRRGGAGMARAVVGLTQRWAERCDREQRRRLLNEQTRNDELYGFAGGVE